MKIITEKPVYDFKTKFAEQSEYFERFCHWLEKRPHVRAIRVATNEEEKNGIDVIADTESGSVNFQVKTDFNTHWSGNIVFEIISQAYDDQGCVIGWGFNLLAVDYIVYIVAGTGEIYVFLAKDIVRWVIDNFNTLKPNNPKNPTYTTLNVLIPLKRIRDICRLSDQLNN